MQRQLKELSSTILNLTTTGATTGATAGMTAAGTVTKAPAKPRGRKSRAARDLDTQSKKDAQEIDAAKSCIRVGKSGAWAMKRENHQHWPLVGSRGTIDRRIKALRHLALNEGVDVLEALDDLELDVPRSGPGEALNQEEYKQFAAAIKAASWKNNPQDRKDMRLMVRGMLTHRKRLADKGEPVDKLNHNAMQIINGGDPEFDGQRHGTTVLRPSDKWFRRFFPGEGKDHGVSEKKECNQDRKRANATTRSEAQRHLDELKHCLMYLPTPVVDRNGDPILDEHGAPKTTPCSPEEAIIHPVTGVFQSGDPKLYEEIRTRAAAVDLLQQLCDRTLTAALQAAGCSAGASAVFPATTQKGLDQARRQLTAAKEYLQAARDCCQRRGMGRVIGLDEMSQFICFDGGKGNYRRRVACATGTVPLRVNAEERECFSYSIVHDLLGRFGPIQLNFAVKALMANMMAPQLHTSPNILLHCSESGVQTGETLRQYYTAVYDWLKEERHDAVGSYTVCHPVVNVADGHGSRFNQEVLQLNADRNVRQFLEPAGSSGTLQCLDQVFSECHGKYNRMLDQRRAAHDAKELLKVSNGAYASVDECVPFVATRFDAIEAIARMHPQGQPTWVDAETMEKACHRCGLTAHGPDIDAIPAERLFDDRAGGSSEAAAAATAPSEPDALLLTTTQNLALLPEFCPSAAMTPAELQAAELQHLKEENQKLRELYRKPQTAAEAGVFLPATNWHSNAPSVGGTKKVRKGNADCDLFAKAVLEKSKQRDREDAQKATTAAARSRTTLATWTRCAGGCTCGSSPCVAAKMRLCVGCRHVKSRVCQIGHCLAAVEQRRLVWQQDERPGRLSWEASEAEILADATAQLLASSECKEILAAPMATPSASASATAPVAAATVAAAATGVAAAAPATVEAATVGAATVGAAASEPEPAPLVAPSVASASSPSSDEMEAAMEVETADGDGSSVQEDAGEQQLEQESERAPAAKRQRCSGRARNTGWSKHS